MPNNAKKLLSLPVADDTVSQSVSPGAEPGVLLADMMNSMEQGVIVWDAKGICAHHNDRVYEVLELNEDDLCEGMSRADFLQMAVNRGEFPQHVADRATAKFKNGKPFSFERTMPSGRQINTAARPRDSGGFVVTFSDITELKNNEKELGDAKNRAESAEAELVVQLKNLKTEKRALEKQQIQLSRLSLVATHAQDLIAITDAKGEIEWVNDAFTDSLGYQFDEVSGKLVSDVLVDKESDRAVYDGIVEAINQRSAVRTEVVCHGKDAQSIWMGFQISPVFTDTGKHEHFVAVCRDRSKRKASDQEAKNARDFELRKQNESKLLAEFNGWLQASDSLGELFNVASGFLCKLLPASSGAIYVYSNSRDVLEGVCNWNGGRMESTFEPGDCWALRRGRSYFFGENEVDFPCQHVEQSYGEKLPERHYCLPIIAHGDTVGLLCIDLPNKDDDPGHDTRKLASFCGEQISLAIANVKLREQLRDQSTRDPLTSLYNRRYFIECVRRELSKCSDKKPSSIISFDVDHFKKFNDNFGHDAGDTVLRSISEVLTSAFRDTDTPCRYGGEEFAVFLPGASAAIAIERAEQLRQIIERTTVRYSGDELAVTISSGVSTFPENGTAVQSLIKSSDKALYAAKDQGRNKVVHIDDLK